MAIVLLAPAIAEFLHAEYPNDNVSVDQFKQLKNGGARGVMVQSEGGSTAGFGDVMQAIVTETISVYVREKDLELCITKTANIYEYMLNNYQDIANKCVSSINVLNSPYLYSKTDSNEYIYNFRINLITKQ
jgi:hypothetical protein